MTGIAYLCDQRACEKGCSYPLCKHTFDISHAVNFKQEFGFYIEQEKEVNDVDCKRVPDESLEASKPETE